jgi:hypothetical protein
MVLHKLKADGSGGQRQKDAATTREGGYWTERIARESSRKSALKEEEYNRELIIRAAAAIDRRPIVTTGRFSQ